MGVFTADLNEIRELIQQGEMSPLDVRIIKAAKAQSIQILNCYPNIEELRCPVLCRDTLKILPTYLSVATKLKNLTVICMVTQDIPDEIIFADENENMTMTEEPPVKKHKGISEVEKITQLEIPYII